MHLHLDPSALLSRPGPAELRRYRRERDPLLRPGGAIGGIILTLIVAAVLLAVAVQAVIGLTSPTSGRGDRVGGAFALVALVLLALALWWLRRRGSAQQYRLERFAADNRLRFSSMAPPLDEPGLLFGIGASRRFIQRFDSLREESWWAGNYRYTVKRGKNTHVYTWGVFSIRLERQMPHLVLDAKSNNLFRASNLPVQPSGAQRLSLEGDFDKHFTLYCPTGYERDALYIFTPDVMAALIDTTGNYDVEIVQDRLYCYRTTMDFTRTEQWLELQRIAEQLGSRALRQTRRYADERIGDAAIDYVAPRGQRLRTNRWNHWTAIGAAALVVFFLLDLLLRRLG